MAAANSDQENVLLSSDDGSPNTPPPARRLPFKAAVAVGLCVFAAGLAGAVMMGRPAARAPTKIWHRWSATGLNEHEFKHMTEECVELLEALEKEAEEEGRTHEAGSGYSPGTLNCTGESEQACTLHYSMYNMSITQEKCFPAVCKEENIFKELEEAMAEVPPDAELSGLTVSCVSSGEDEGTTTREPWAQYLSEECHDGLVKLEKEAEKNGRKHSADSAEDLDCKESEQTCTVSFSQTGKSFEVAKCFPADCKQQNIYKGIRDSNEKSDSPSAYELYDIKVSCGGAPPSAECPEDTPAIRISNHEDDDYNGVYHLKKPLNNKPHYVKDKKYHLYYWVYHEDPNGVYQLDDRHQDGVKDQWRGGMQSDPRGTGLIQSGEWQWALDDRSEFAINIECMDE